MAINGVPQKALGEVFLKHGFAGIGFTSSTIWNLPSKTIEIFRLMVRVFFPSRETTTAHRHTVQSVT